MEKIIPREITSGEHLEQMYPNLINLGSSQSNPDVMEEDQTKEYNKTDINAINESVGKPIYDLLDRGGKQWRPLLGLMFAEQFGRNIEDIEANKDIYFASGLTEIIHNGSLMVDDLQDGSLMRRGDLCSYKKFGIDVAVNTGNLMYLAPMC
jgi:geranylgeranyl pyrophosphate synthase